MNDPAQYINAPLGQPGSGRVRYGAAMALYRAGRMTADMLEVYRVASAHDARDPLAVLRERGLPLPEISMTQSPVARLYASARDYLLTLDHPGSAEVRAGLSPDPGAERAMPSRQNAVVAHWLQPALALVAKDQPELAAALGGASGHLEWITYDAYPRDQIGEAFAMGHAYAAIRGGDAPFAATEFELGVFLIAPGVLYRDHRHAAPELYAPLTGPHGWRFGVDRPLIVKPAHQPVWNPPHQPHLTKVGSVPFLCLFVWTKDVNEEAVVIPAADWAALEAITLA
ncbi:dimethylsulfonioproprionate lyase family protein [Gemmobacter denitrificans]|uniref:Dimethylsulfonioproprionate lyase family protein n=1 Tax=Gemmobacter denitrificans TaxID=3123040 RepID=A0ABU8BVI8_9RHOB